MDARQDGFGEITRRGSVHFQLDTFWRFKFFANRDYRLANTANVLTTT